MYFGLLVVHTSNDRFIPTCEKKINKDHHMTIMDIDNQYFEPKTNRALT